jgi:hypothetical protein
MKPLSNTAWFILFLLGGIVVFGILNLLMGTINPARGASFSGAANFVVGGADGVSYQIDDDFSTDTSADYTTVLRGITVSGGVAYGNATSYQNAAVLHDTSLDSFDHWVEVRVSWSDSSSAPGLPRQITAPMIRCTPTASPLTSTDGYTVFIDPVSAGKGILYRIDDSDVGNPVWVGEFSAFPESWDDGVYYATKLEAVGDTFTYYVDFNNDGSYAASETLGELNDSTYTGTRIGIFWSNWEAPHLYVDDLKAD